MGRAATAFAILATLGVGIVSGFLRPLNGDVAWLLHASMAWMGGGELYVDVIETNPPLIIWLTAAALRLTGLFGLEPALGVRAAVFALSAGSAAVSGVLLHRATRSRLVAVVPAVVLIALPGANFGEREHLLTALALPYVIASACPDLVSRRTMLAFGVAAGVAIALKPYFIGFFLFTEFVRWRETRRLLGPGTVAVISVGVAYLVAVIVAAPAFIEFARATLRFYGHFRNKSWWVLPLAHYSPIAILAAVGCTVSVRRPYRALRLASFLAALALLGAVFVQRKAFTYHALPAASFSLLFLALTVAGRAEAHRMRARIVAGWLAVLTAYGLAASGPPSDVGDVPRLTAIMGRYRGEPVATFSTSYSPTWPSVIDAGVRWALPAASLWGPVAGHVMQPTGGPYRARADMPERERWLLDVTVEALMREPPAAVIVDRRNWTVLAVPFDPVRYLSAHPAFPAFWSQYARTDSVPRFTVYERRP